MEKEKLCQNTKRATYAQVLTDNAAKQNSSHNMAWLAGTWYIVGVYMASSWHHITDSLAIKLRGLDRVLIASSHDRQNINTVKISFRAMRFLSFQHFHKFLNQAMPTFESIIVSFLFLPFQINYHTCKHIFASMFCTAMDCQLI